MKTAIKTLTALLSVMTTDAAAGQIDLTMTGFASDAGAARIILMRGVEEYTSVRAVSRVDSVPILDGQAHWTATVPPGTYGIIAHHDQNANDDLDRPVFGLPLEAYGYSNGAWTSAGIPSFDEVAFEVGAGTAPQRIPMRVNAFVTLAQIVAASALALSALFALVTLRRRTSTTRTA